MDVISNLVNWTLGHAPTLFYFLLVLGVLVLVHELGHFATAKWAGVRVEEFGLGIPPRAWTFWKGAGMIQVQGKKILIPRRFKLPDSIRIGSWVTYKTQMENGREVLLSIDPVDAESRGAALASQVQDLDTGTLYTLNWLPLGGFVRMTGEENPSDPRSFAAQKPWKRMIILVAGVTMNMALAIAIYSIIAMNGLPKLPDFEIVRVAQVAPNSPAAAAGLQPDDRLLSVNGIIIQNSQHLRRLVNLDYAGQEVTIELKRDKDVMTVKLTPRINPPRGQGAMGITMALQQGTVEIVSYPIWEAVPKGVEITADITLQMFRGFGRIFLGLFQGQGTPAVGGPVEIARQTGEIAQQGWLSLLQFTAILSINLAIINMLPIPALDGGRLMFVLLEIVRGGKRIAPEKEGFVHFAGMAFLLLLMLVITFFDIQRALGGG
jgi:regulator of sigma E protease